MDEMLIDYLHYGKAWIFVGSGPSIEMGYPSWKTLATTAYEVLTKEIPGTYKTIYSALKVGDYPTVFEEVKSHLGYPKLLDALQGIFKPSKQSEIYKHIAKWPAFVYLTTNYDDEIQRHLTALREHYITYTNSEDHFASLTPDLSGAIFKLHGDLRSANGLVLTKSQYKDITESPAWEYWRVKMTSIFQLQKIVVIGHSLTDENIQHVLKIAKKGSGVKNPICWIAPDVVDTDKRRYLEDYKIRVVSYDNKDNGHKNLATLIKKISEFTGSRTTVNISSQTRDIIQSSNDGNAAATGLFVFNKFIKQDNYEERRIGIFLSAIQSVILTLKKHGEFTIEEALRISGWPNAVSLDSKLTQAVKDKAISSGILEPVNNLLKIGPRAEQLYNENTASFNHLRERFISSLIFRLERDYSNLTDTDRATIAKSINNSLVGYFKEGGLTLATTLFSNESSRLSGVPSSIVKFINDASSQYSSLLKRQAFSTTSLDIFLHPGDSERNYLGRISQGFFAYHALGVFGDTAIERLNQAKKTVWIVDSSVQIPILALDASTEGVFRECFKHLHESGIRLFTTNELFKETLTHLSFARYNIIKQYGASSQDVIAAARGQAPFRKSNQFLEGFIRWQSIGNPCDWDKYLYQIFNDSNPSEEAIKKILKEYGIEVVNLSDWPGYKQEYLSLKEEYIQNIVRKYNDNSIRPEDIDMDMRKKAEPEAEALLVVKLERSGDFNILSGTNEASKSWFISQTSMLNLIELNTHFTWQPEAFLRFASTISTRTVDEAQNNAFEIILWGIAQAGISLINEDTIYSVFGGIIDQKTLTLIEENKKYADVIERKYGEPLESVIKRVPYKDRLLAEIQLAREISDDQSIRAEMAEKKAAEETKRANDAERELKDVKFFKRKMERKQGRKKRKGRK